VQIADFGAGALGAVAKILAALLERERTGRGQHVVISMTHNAHRLASRPMLTGGLACYRIYGTADGRWLTVAALEPVFWQRLIELLARPDLADRQYADDQDSLSAELAAVFETRQLAQWLELFDGEDVCAGPVATHAEAADEFGAR
jgi:crotonobetainyl-CoA:carnitine CoA-transferase CaiB-like acyl-CoA transferase